MVSNSAYKRVCDERDELLKQLQELKENRYKLDANLHPGDLVSIQMVKRRYCEACCHPGPFCPDQFCKEVNEIFDCLLAVQSDEVSDVEEM